MSTIKKGDRVKATHKTYGDVAEFTVVSAYINGDVTSKVHYYRDRDWSFEVVGTNRHNKRGIFLYRSYGLDKDGDLSEFPNIILHLSADPDKDWYSVSNISATVGGLTLADVQDAQYGSMVELTLKEQEG